MAHTSHSLVFKEHGVRGHPPSLLESRPWLGFLFTSCATSCFVSLLLLAFTPLTATNSRHYVRSRSSTTPSRSSLSTQTQRVQVPKCDGDGIGPQKPLRCLQRHLKALRATEYCRSGGMVFADNMHRCPHQHEAHVLSDSSSLYHRQRWGDSSVVSGSSQKSGAPNIQNIRIRHTRTPKLDFRFLETPNLEPGIPYGNFTEYPVNLNRRILCPAGRSSSFTLGGLGWGAHFSGLLSLSLSLSLSLYMYIYIYTYSSRGTTGKKSGDVMWK